MVAVRKGLRRLGFPLFVAAAATLLGACGGHGEAPSPPPPGGDSPSASPAPTTAVVPSPTPPPSETPPTTTAGPPTTAAADPRSIPVGSLLRPGTTPVAVRYGDLDGDGVDDIVVASASKHGGVVPQPYVDVFLFDGKGHWPRAWEATGPSPPGVVGTPVSVVLPAGATSLHQEVDTLGLVDVRGDGTDELVVGVLNLGAGPGPLDVWVIGFGPGGPVTEFWEETRQGGVLLAGGDTVRLQTPSFGPDDPSCCPSRIEHQTIGFDPSTDSVRVLERSFTPVR